MSNLIELINAELPQFQCGRCDTPGCRPYAEEIANGSPHNRCVPGGQVTLDRISDILNRDSLVLDHDYGPDLKPQVAHIVCLLYTSPSPRDATLSRMPSSA